MQPPPNLAYVRPLLERMASTVWPVLRQSVTPITVIQGERTIQWGTGTFFRVAEDSFMVTACHVWDEAARCGFDHDLHVFDLDGHVQGDVQMRPVPLTGTVHCVKAPPDVAIFELAPEVVSALDGRRFLRLNEVELRARQPGRCWVFGFPSDATELIPAQSHFRFNQFFMLAPFYERPVALENYDPVFHFLLDGAKDDLCQLDGTAAEMPRHLNGISGCSIWRPEWPASNSPEDWSPDRTRIVGVQTSYYPKTSVIRATHWAAVANALYQRRPDLRPAIEFHLGPAR